jgi:hypothetical protein
MKNIVEHCDTTISMMKNLFLYMLSVPSNLTLMNIAKRHAIIVIELAINYEIIMNKKCKLKANMYTRLESSKFCQLTNIVEEEIDYGENGKQHAPII